MASEMGQIEVAKMNCTRCHCIESHVGNVKRIEIKNSMWAFGMACDISHWRLEPRCV